MAQGPGGFSVGRVSIQVVPDTSKFRQKLLAELKKEVKGLKIEIPVDLDMAKAVAQLKVLDSILKKIDGRNINIGATVSSNGNLDKISKDLSKVGKSASEAAGGFSSIGRTGAIALAVLVLIAPALALIATLIAGLPSLLFAFGFAALAVGLGLDGIKKAASGFAPTIERLKKSLSKTFADQLTKPFIELNKIAPVLDTGLNKIAVSLSHIIQDMIKFATSVQGMKAINTILQNTARFFELLRPAFQDGFGALVELAAAASEEFDRLAGTFNNFARNFRAIVNEASASGVLQSALMNLNMVLNSLLRAFNKFFEAGLQAMTVLGGPIVNLVNGFTDLLVSMMPILTEISVLVFNVLGEAFQQLGPIFEALTPAITALGDLLGTLLIGALRALGPLLTVVANILNKLLLKALEAITPFIQPFLNFVTQLAEVIGTALTDAFIALTPFLDQFFGFISQLLVALTPLLPKLVELAQVALKALTDALLTLSPFLLDAGTNLFPQLVQVVTDLVPILSRVIDILIQVVPPLLELAATILSFVMPAMTELFGIVQAVWPSIEQIISGALTFIQGIINVVLGIITGDWDRAWKGLGQILEGAWVSLKGTIKAGIATFLELLIGIPSRIAVALGGLPAQFAQSGRAMMQGLVDGIKSMAQTVINSALNVVSQVRNLLPFSPAKTGPFSGTGYTFYSGQALMEDWAKGIQKGAPAAVSAVEDAMAATQNGMDINAAVAAEGFGDLQGQIMSAMSGWEVVIDANGITKMVNKTNNSNRRR